MNNEKKMGQVNEGVLAQKVNKEVLDETIEKMRLSGMDSAARFLEDAAYGGFLGTEIRTRGLDASVRLIETNDVAGYCKWTFFIMAGSKSTGELMMYKYEAYSYIGEYELLTREHFRDVIFTLAFRTLEKYSDMACEEENYHKHILNYDVKTGSLDLHRGGVVRHVCHS